MHASHVQIHVDLHPNIDIDTGQVQVQLHFLSIHMHVYTLYMHYIALHLSLQLSFASTPNEFIGISVLERIVQFSLDALQGHGMTRLCADLRYVKRSAHLVKCACSGCTNPAAARRGNEHGSKLLYYTHCCSACRRTHGKEHGLKCTRYRVVSLPPEADHVHHKMWGQYAKVCRHASRLEMSGFVARSKMIRCKDSCVMEYLAWLHLDMGAELRWQWSQTAWIFKVAMYDRHLKLHAIPESECEGLETCTFWCTDLDAHSGDYHMSDVTGLDMRVVVTLLGQKCFAVKLREIVTAVEASSLEQVNLVCHGGTHRSVATAFVLMLMAYPRARFFPHTPRVLQAARTYLDI